MEIRLLRLTELDTNGSRALFTAQVVLVVRFFLYAHTIPDPVAWNVDTLYVMPLSSVHWTLYTPAVAIVNCPVNHVILTTAPVLPVRVTVTIADVAFL